jgi:Zn-dependent peptidase ImmA (M78 family)
MTIMPLLTVDRQRDIETRVNDMCARIGLSYPDNGIMDICKALNIEVKEGDFGADHENVSGMVRARGEDGKNVPQIFLNHKNSPERKTFTIAHEVAHLELGHVRDEKFRIDKFDYLHDDRNEETEANYFAACLLVPRFKLEEAYTAYFGDIKLIARFFQVSTGMIETRLSWLKKNPV